MSRRGAAVLVSAVAVLGAGTASAEASTSGPTLTLDQGLHVSVGSVLGTDASAMLATEGGGYQYGGILVPVYAKWHMSSDVVAMGSSDGLTDSLASSPDATEDSGLECCTPMWEWSDVRTTYGGTDTHPLFSRDSTITTYAVAHTDVQALAYNAAGARTVENATYRVFVTQQGGATFSAGWTTGAGKIWSGGSVLKSSRAGQSASFTATANQFALVTDHGTGRGTADVYLDGKKFASINDAGASVNRVVDAQIYKVARAQHTLKVVVTRGRIDIDALVTS